MAQALAYLHDLAMVHRDLKASPAGTLGSEFLWKSEIRLRHSSMKACREMQVVPASCRLNVLLQTKDIVNPVAKLGDFGCESLPRPRRDSGENFALENLGPDSWVRLFRPSISFRLLFSKANVGF